MVKLPKFTVQIRYVSRFFDFQQWDDVSDPMTLDKARQEMELIRRRDRVNHFRIGRAVQLAMVAASLFANAAHAAQMADPFPIAPVAEERENHALSINRPGQPVRCLALVSTRDDGQVLVALATPEGKPLTFAHGPYPKEQYGVMDVVATFGRDC